MTVPLGAAPVSAIRDQVRFILEHVGSDALHSGTTLLCHLFGTYELLAAWGCRQALCNAGLFHSIYGTEAYTHLAVSFSRRDDIRKVIDTHAERLVYVYAMMRRESFADCISENGPGPRDLRLRGSGAGLAAETISHPEFCDICHIVAANWVEPRKREAGGSHIPVAELEKLSHFLNDPARKAVAMLANTDGAPWS